VRRLHRFFVNALTVLSLLLFVVTVALWVRGFRTADIFGVNFDSGGDGMRAVRIHSDTGSFAVVVVAMAPHVEPPSPGWF
jgi:hypothetical protein